MCKSHVERSYEVSQDLIRQANTIEQHCSHDSCLVLAGILRDCGLKVRGATDLAESEMKREMESDDHLHKTLGSAS